MTTKDEALQMALGALTCIDAAVQGGSMSKKPDAMRLADALEMMSLSTKWDKQAAKELRRLYEVNRELLEACERLMSWDFFSKGVGMVKEDADFARAAIAKATGEKA